MDGQRTLAGDDIRALTKSRWMGAGGAARGRWRRLWMGALHAMFAMAVVAGLGVAADYGVGSAQAAVTLDAATLSNADVSGGESGSDAKDYDPGDGFVRLVGHVPAGLAKATLVDSGASAASDAMTLNLVMRRDDQAGFEEYLQQVYDARSTSYRHFLTQKQLTQRFGPSARHYAEVTTYLRAHGLRVVSGSKNRITLTVSGSQSAVERALRVQLQHYRQGDKNFYATTTDPALPAGIAGRVLSIDGLSSLSTPSPANMTTPWVCQNYATGGPAGVLRCKARGFALAAVFGNLACMLELFGAAGATNVAAGAAGVATGGSFAVVGPFWNNLCPFMDIGTNWNNLQMYSSARLRTEVADSSNAARLHAAIGGSTAQLKGTGQKIGLLEYDTFYMSDVSNFLALSGAASVISNLSVVPVNGGVATPGSGESEVLLDIDTVMALAPGAQVVVYDAPFTGQAASYSTLFNAMINGGVTIISNSWASCEDQVSQAEAMGIDTVLQTAAASGISVFNGTGDSGSTCLDGNANTISVPADSPHATAVGGTSYPNGYGQGAMYSGETWWDGSTQTPATGQGGFGVSRYFARPAYQNGLNANAMRSVPDVAILADPNYGLFICEQDNGGCPVGFLTGGTSLAAPEWAAVAASINQVQGKNLGAFNPVLYPLAATDGFHNASSMSSDFSHVGLGSPNTNVINRLLKGQAVGLPIAAHSLVSLVPPETPVRLNADGSFAVPADGQTAGGVRVTLVDANGNIVSGKTVTLTPSGGAAVVSPASGVSTVADGAVLFTITDTTAEGITYTATDTTDGIVLGTVAFTFGVPAAASAGITADPPTLPADGVTPATIIVTLKDALNRPTPGKSITVSDAGAHAVITGPTTGVTDANGQIQFSATDQINETVTFSAVDVTDNLPVPGSGTVTYSGSTSTACGVGTVPVAGTGFGITQYVTGLPSAATIFYGGVNIGCPGANNPAFTSDGALLASDFDTGAIYQTSLSGGAVSSANVLSTLTPALGPLVYGKDGSLYATLGDEGAEIVQIDPTTGAQMRVVASGLTCPAGLSVDPLSGDLFFDDECTGGGTDDASIYRVIDPANTNPSKPTSVVVYATLPTTPNGGMAFAPNGTLYAVTGYFVPPAAVEQISGTNASAVTVTPITGITSSFGVAVGAANADGSAQSLIVASTGGVLSEVPIASPGSPTVLVSQNAPGPGVVGPDGCLYSAGHDAIYKISNSTGGCSFTPTSPAPSIKLTPATESATLAQGSAQTFTATLKNVATLTGVPVEFLISGANPQFRLADTVSGGSAALTYSALQAGKDSITAVATVNGKRLVSNAVPITWVAGKHATYLSLNTGPQAGTISQPVNIVVSLTDISASPTAAVAGQAVTLSLGTSSCTATTNSAGMASCALTPSQAGIGALTAHFAGSSALAASVTSVGFNVSYGPTGPPTVSIAVSPTSTAAGSPATLTWSATNATACTASGSWSGTEATSGTRTVTPASTGSYSYTLSCIGNGGSATATAVLSATLVAVTVNAKSGGGAITGAMLALLMLLVVLRLGGAMPAGRFLRATRVGLAVLGLAGFISAAGSGVARADQAAADSYAAPVNWTDALYAGIRVGSMPVRLESASRIDQSLAARGYGEVSANTDTSGTAGTAFLGYEFSPYVGVELGYTYRDSDAAQLHGNIGSSANLRPLLQDTTELLRGYGNIVSLSYAAHLEVAPRLMIEPRLGGFFWATKVTAVSADERFDTTHEGGGVTVGATAAYRVWRGLELGFSIDHFRGFPNNVATLYGGSVEWRFGH